MCARAGNQREGWCEQRRIRFPTSRLDGGRGVPPRQPRRHRKHATTAVHAFPPPKCRHQGDGSRRRGEGWAFDGGRRGGGGGDAQKKRVGSGQRGKVIQ